MIPVPRFLCPALGRGLRTHSKLSPRQSRSPLLKNIDKLEAYIQSLKKTVKRQSLGRKQVQQDDLSDREMTEMYAALASRSQPAIVAPKDLLPEHLRRKMDIAASDLASSVDWNSKVSTLIGSGSLGTLTANDANSLLTAMPHASRIQAGRRLFDSMISKPNRLTYDLLMDSYASNGQVADALEMFDLSRKSGLVPSVYSYAHLMKAFAITKDLKKASAMYQYMQEHGVEPNLVIYTSLIATCVRAREIGQAFSIFDTLKYKSRECAPDTQTYSLMIHACSLDPKLSAERAADLFQEMTERGLAPTRETFNSLIHVYATRKDYFSEAWRMSELMQSNKIEMDKTTWHSLLSACVANRDIMRARKLVIELFRLSSNYPSWTPDAITYQLLFRAYAHAKVRRSLNPRYVLELNMNMQPKHIRTEDMWLDQEPFTSNAVLHESSQVLLYVTSQFPQFVSTQLLDTFMTIGQSFEAVETFRHNWRTLYKDHAKGRYSFEIGLRAAYAFKDWELLQLVWSERQSWRSTCHDAQQAPLSKVDIHGDFEATRLYIEALSRLNRIQQASDVLDKARTEFVFRKSDLKCFQTKSLQVGDEEAVLLYREIFPDREILKRQSYRYH